jgi:hypothetical protein
VPRRVYLKQIVQIDGAQTDLPVPVGQGRWAFIRQQMRRLRLDPAMRETLGAADLVLAVDHGGRPQGIAYGLERLVRVAASGVSEETTVLHVVLDDTSRKLGSDSSDLELLTAACLVAKGEDVPPASGGSDEEAR